MIIFLTILIFTFLVKLSSKDVIVSKDKKLSDGVVILPTERGSERSPWTLQSLSFSEVAEWAHENDNADSVLAARLKSVNLLPKCTQEEPNFVYIKTHKCGSDTLSVVFRRFGIKRNLSFAQPVGKMWNIGWPQYPEPYMYRASKDGKYNIITDHSVYNETLMDAMMVPGTKYFTSIREPLDHFKSSFSYFGIAKKTGLDKNESAGLDKYLAFLRDKEYYHNSIKLGINYPSPVRSMMSFDLGFPIANHKDDRDILTNAAYIEEWIDKLEKKFVMVGKMA